MLSPLTELVPSSSQHRQLQQEQQRINENSKRSSKKNYSSSSSCSFTKSEAGRNDVRSGPGGKTPSPCRQTKFGRNRDGTRASPVSAAAIPSSPCTVSTSALSIYSSSSSAAAVAAAATTVGASITRRQPIVDERRRHHLMKLARYLQAKTVPLNLTIPPMTNPDIAIPTWRMFYEHSELLETTLRPLWELLLLVNTTSHQSDYNSHNRRFMTTTSLLNNVTRMKGSSRIVFGDDGIAAGPNSMTATSSKTQQQQQRGRSQIRFRVVDSAVDTISVPIIDDENWENDDDDDIERMAIDDIELKEEYHRLRRSELLLKLQLQRIDERVRRIMNSQRRQQPSISMLLNAEEQQSKSLVCPLVRCNEFSIEFDVEQFSKEEDTHENQVEVATTSALVAASSNGLEMKREQQSQSNSTANKKKFVGGMIGAAAALSVAGGGGLLSELSPFDWQQQRRVDISSISYGRALRHNQRYHHSNHTYTGCSHTDDSLSSLTIVDGDSVGCVVVNDRCNIIDDDYGMLKSGRRTTYQI
jgi:hypothetical protein